MSSRPLAALAVIVVVVAGCSSDADDTSRSEATTSTTLVESTTTSTDADSTTATSGQQDTATTTTQTPVPTVPLDRLELSLELVAEANGPVALAPRPGTRDLYVVEQRGRIVRLVDGEILDEQVVLDLQGDVSNGNEQGLLGLVFSDDGQELFVNYTDRRGTSRVVRYDMNDDSADTSSAVEIISVDQPRGNHNGGHLAFGPDGFLYIGLGDGGGGGDPFDNGQDPSTLLGSMLRIDPTGDADRPYAIPADNPFASGGDGAPEVFAWGLRNPWRYSFDAANGDLWIGDVGQNNFEEISVLRVAAGGGNGANLGWNELEGDASFQGGDTPPGYVAPRVVYPQTQGRCSVTGGEVYRGSEIPSLVGVYVFGDFCTGEIFGVDASSDAPMQPLDIDLVSQLTSFGTDLDGELYALSRGGAIFRVEAQT